MLHGDSKPPRRADESTLKGTKHSTEQQTSDLRIFLPVTAGLFPNSTSLAIFSESHTHDIETSKIWFTPGIHGSAVGARSKPPCVSGPWSRPFTILQRCVCSTTPLVTQTFEKRTKPRGINPSNYFLQRPFGVKHIFLFSLLL